MQRPGEAGLTERLRLWKECEYHRIDELKSTGTHTHTHTHTFKCSLSVSAPLKVREMVQMAFCTKSATFLKCGQMHTYGIKLAWLPPHNTSFISFIFALPSPSLCFSGPCVSHTYRHFLTCTDLHTLIESDSYLVSVCLCERETEREVLYYPSIFHKSASLSVF